MDREGGGGYGGGRRGRKKGLEMMSGKGRILVCGLGKSGMAAARLALGEGRGVTVADTRDTETVRELGAELAGEGAEVVYGAKGVPEGVFEVAVVSPGLAADDALLEGVRARGIRMESEVDWGWQHRGGGVRTVAVTGSNGKTSVVRALAEILGGEGSAGGVAVACGNYGVPVSEAVGQVRAGGWLVVELSSFQMETTEALRPDIAVLLNLLPNHLDRHGTMAEYMRLKSKMFARQGAGDVAVVPADGRELSGLAPQIPAGVRTVRFDGELPAEIGGSYFDNAVLRTAAGAIWAAARAAGVADERIRSVLKRFEGLPHRNRLVRTWRGVRLVDDSKATNLAAMVAGLRMQPEGTKIRLIAGGRPKETDFSGAREELARRVARCYLIGEAAAGFAASWEGTVPCVLCGTLEAAFARATAEARPGETVLLAPACTAFDQFASYAERGRRFEELAEGLGEG